MTEVDDLIPVPEAARLAEVSRNTMLLAAKHGAIKAKQIGRGWFVYKSDIERWKRENYRPDMAFRYPIKKPDGGENPT
jgi:excisionase family DNA binding protein